MRRQQQQNVSFDSIDFISCLNVIHFSSSELFLYKTMTGDDACSCCALRGDDDKNNDQPSGDESFLHTPHSSSHELSDDNWKCEICSNHNPPEAMTCDQCCSLRECLPSGNDDQSDDHGIDQSDDHGTNEEESRGNDHSSFDNAQSSSEDPDDPNKILREAGENVSDDAWEAKERLHQEEEMLETFKKTSSYVGESDRNDECKFQFNYCDIIILTLFTEQL